MKTKLFFIPVILAVFIALFAANGTAYEPAAPPAPEDGCCQEICLTRNGEPVAGCYVCISNGMPSTHPLCGYTDNNGKITFCGLTPNTVYKVSFPDNCCGIQVSQPQFTACSNQCYSIQCQP